MKKEFRFKLIASILGLAFLASSIFVIAKPNLTSIVSKADSSYNITLNHSNAPTLSAGSATRIDEKNINWEYNNCADYNNGHVSINHKGYFGISHLNYGVTGISSLIANFSASNSELWLLTSVDGITWSEDSILESGTAVSTDYRYVRLYNYSLNNTAINISSLNLTYSCTGISATEDVDSAKVSNVISTSTNLSYTAEYSDISPNSIGGEAVSFTKVDTGNTDLTISFGKTYKVGPTQNAKVEFDMKTSNINYGKSIGLMLNNTTLGSVIYSNKGTSYKCTNIQDDWYHIEVPITTFISTISGYNGKDKPHTDIENKEYNAIKINAGTCVIDNLRLTSSPCELGIFNNPTYKPAVGEAFWLKVSWVGKLYPEQVTMTFSDDSMARRISLDDPLLTNGSPFYIELLSSGTFTVTCNVTCGYDRHVQTIQHTITIK